MQINVKKTKVMSLMCISRKGNSKTKIYIDSNK